MIDKKFLKRYIHNQEVLSKIEAVLAISSNALETFWRLMTGIKTSISIQM